MSCKKNKEAKTEHMLDLLLIHCFITPKKVALSVLLDDPISMTHPLPQSSSSHNRAFVF